MTKLQKKLNAVELLRNSSQLESSEQDLAFAVIERAVMDIGSSKHDPTPLIRYGWMTPWYEAVALSPAYVRLVLKQSGLIDYSRKY